MIIIPIKWLFHWEYTLFSDKPIWVNKKVNWNVILEVFGFERWSCKLRILETGSYDLKRNGHTMIIATPPYFHIMKHSDIINLIWLNQNNLPENSRNKATFE